MEMDAGAATVPTVHAVVRRFQGGGVFCRSQSEMAGEDPDHLRKLRALPCAVGTNCSGRMHAHHPIGVAYRGMSQRAHDHLAIPLCSRHHTEFHNAVGFFKSMKKAERRAWQATMSERYMPRAPADDVF